MLNDYEKKSLKMIFDRIPEEKLSGTIATLIESFEENFINSAYIPILKECFEKINLIEKNG